MRKPTFALLFVALFTLLSFSSAVTARDKDDAVDTKPKAQKPPTRDFDSTYKMVCEGTNRDIYCNKIDSKVNREVADTLTAMRPVIHAAAKTYGVDPATIVGALLAEHSMNTSATDIAQDALVSLGLAKNGTINFGFYKKTFTYGFGQLNYERAIEAEKIAAQIEQRPMRNSDQVNATLMTPEGSAYYAAALVRQAQDLYLAAGYDLSEDPATLTTLYNIGKIDERLERTKKEGRPPQPNYFGLFVLKNKDRIKEIVGDYNPNSEISIASQNSKAPADSPYITRYRASVTLMPLKSGMASIGANSAAFSTGNFVLKEGDQFDLVGSIDDASLGTLHLVKNNEGQMGYLPEAVIAKKAKSILVNKSTCAINGSKKCLADMDTYLSEKEGETFAHLQEVGRPDKKPLSPREEILLIAQKQAEEMLNAFASEAFQKSGKQAKEFITKIDNYLSQMEPVLGDYEKTAHTKIQALVSKKEALEKIPALSESDMVEILGGIKAFREKAAKLQTNGLGVLGSPYAMLEPLMEFYEACAVEHHGESARVRAFFNSDTYTAAFFGDSTYSIEKALAFKGGGSNNRGENLENWIANKLSFIRYGRKADLMPSQQKGHEGEMIRKNSGENCYGEKEEFLKWLKSVPMKADPAWQDLEPSLDAAANFFNPIINQTDLSNRKKNIPAEINEVKSNMARNLATIQKHYPKLKEKLLAAKKIFETTEPKEIAKMHPAVQLLQSIRNQFRDCRIATHKDKELMDKLEGLDSSLGKDIQVVIDYYRNSQGGYAKIVDYEVRDALQYLFAELFPNSSTNGINPNKIFNEYAPEFIAMNQNVKDYLERWSKLGRALESSCAVFENPLVDAYLNHPEWIPAGGETCLVDFLNKEAINRSNSIENIQLSLLDIKQQFGNEKERYKFVNDTIDSLGWRPKDYGGKTAQSAARFPTYHDLAKELSEKDCVKTIFVSRVQELDLPKTVFLPSGNDSSIRVVWKGSKCN